MSEVVAVVEQGDNLTTLVKEAFIDPIRSVLIIDDRYPTWDTIFGAGYDRADEKWATPEAMLEVVRQFRDKSPALTVDIHDGGDTAEISRSLHQSDLLVLDYQLEDAGPYGVKAAGILRKLLSSTHFNLVVVHTDTDDLIDPFNKILLSLLTPVADEPDKIARAKVLIDKAGQDGDWDDLEEELEDAVAEGVYLAYRRSLAAEVTPVRFIDDNPLAARFKEICDEARWKPGERRLALCWALAKHESLMVHPEGPPPQFRWRSPGESDHAWIRTNRGFVAFAKKQNTQLLETLAGALADWKPSPSRMISSRIRAEISALGVMAEDTTFSDRKAYWRYYQELLAADVTGDTGDSPRRTLIEAHAARHTERLLDEVGQKAVKFGLKLVACDPAAADKQAGGFASHYEIPPLAEGEQDLTLNHYNAYISTKPVSGWHLQPGHLLKIGKELWVCASPACDLVPEQKTQIGITGSSKAKTKPFLAVKLHVRNDIGRADVNSNTLVFLLGEDGKVSTYGVFEKDAENPSPVWRMLFADNFGKIRPQGKFADLEVSSVTGESGKLEVKTEKVKIVGQLRYEYALNLINKLGVEFTRIGLDFVAPPQKLVVAVE